MPKVAHAHCNSVAGAKNLSNKVADKKTQKMMRGVTKTEGRDNNCCEDLI